MVYFNSVYLSTLFIKNYHHELWLCLSSQISNSFKTLHWPIDQIFLACFFITIIHTEYTNDEVKKYEGNVKANYPLKYKETSHTFKHEKSQESLDSYHKGESLKKDCTWNVCLGWNFANLDKFYIKVTNCHVLDKSIKTQYVSKHRRSSAELSAFEENQASSNKEPGETSFYF